ncbi:MAG: hypothetical protein UW19_C0001G0102 [Candidatus Moranbacteria bacterium GW2011_GWF2_44_10]|nr:MAG: hypothetical protein UW19_C0001G0102 [Candidatus Moranbacteria bacterium GW2011_GWF2_44_10]OGI24428.1 MAG: hypothetical protein A2194_01450 [Candidatus Moranbacteria bacterium RIFOXYA1_FULL_44_8]
MNERTRSRKLARHFPPSPAEEDEPVFSWQAPEYEHAEKHPHWYWVMGIVLLAIIVYALITNSILMAITFILIGMLGYIYAERKPRIIQMKINPDGIQVDNYFYDYDNIRSFWIFYEVEEEIRILSLHSKKTFLPYIHIPVGNANPIKIREALLQYLPEIKQELSALDRLERIIGL